VVFADILGLEHPGSLTGDTHLRSGLVVLLSPIHLIPPHPTPPCSAQPPLVPRVLVVFPIPNSLGGHPLWTPT
jgi:hypothetical protein